MKVLIVGDAVASTGFARCTHAVADTLYARGHDVTILGINHWGSPHPYPYPIYPCIDHTDGGRDQFGVTRLPRLIDRLTPDLVIILQDPWNVPAYFDQWDYHVKNNPDTPHHTCPWVGWIAVDSKNQQGDSLNRFSHVIVWTEFARLELLAGGCTVPISVAPLGVDLSIFTPKPRDVSRKALLGRAPESHRPAIDSFIVGVVGRNQPRKRLDLALAYFADWIHSCNIDNAYLYLHVAPTGEIGFDLQSLASYYKLSGRVMLATPPTGKGDPTSALPYIYSAFDVLLTTSQGEGWGLPVLEAAACGVPSIVPDWAAFDREHGWLGPAALYAPCHTTACTAPIDGLLHTIGGVPDRRLTVGALNLFYRDPALRATYSALALDRAQLYPWSACGTAVADTLETVHQSTIALSSESQPPSFAMETP